MIDIKEIIDNWNIKYDDINEVQNNVWSIDNVYFLKANSDSYWANNLQIYKVLRELGIPAPEVVATKQGDDYLTQDSTNYYLTRKLDGVHLNKEDIIGDATKALSLGRVIGKLHKVFDTITDRFEFYDNNFVSELRAWVKDNLEKYAKDSFTYGIYSDCVSRLEEVYDDLDRHLIHRDMHLGNLLFIDNKVTGYIDFDLTQINARIFDIAYILVGWIVGETQNNIYMNKWKEAVRIVIEGYQQEQRLSSQELKVLIIMMCCVEILFVAYFYGANDLDNALSSEECLKWLWNNKDEIL